MHKDFKKVKDTFYVKKFDGDCCWRECYFSKRKIGENSPYSNSAGKGC